MSGRTKKGISKWNIETIQDWLNNNALGYKVLETKWIQKPYQNQLWSLIKCPNEKHEAYWCFWNGFYSKGRRCKKCYYDKNNIQEWTLQKVLDFYKNYNLKIININEWENVDKSILCIDEQGFKVFASITNLRFGSNPSPFQYNVLALENIKHYCKTYRPEYDILSDKYINIKTEYEWIYLGDYLPQDVNRHFITTADSFINGNVRHPHMSKSDSEIRIENWLKLNNFCYKDEFSFKDCKYKNVLLFDYAIFNYNNELSCLIESQGKQHYEPIGYFGGINAFIEQQIKDKIKKEYCKKNNIQLLEIPYWDFDYIECILEENILQQIL